ncbi:MAG TPA: ubiquitin-like domain-containing protein [Chloroflexota bacterium]|nr:ubiquitin-like domain-containing protein [Chloroflexota bacterium]
MRATPYGSRAGGAFRRLTLFPASGAPYDAAPSAGALYASAGRGLLPLQTGPAAGALPAGPLAAPLLGNLPLLACAAGSALLLSMWGAVVRGGAVAPLPLPALPPLEVTLARFRPAGSEGPDWMLVEVDGRALRAAPGAGSERIEEVLAAAGIRLAAEDRVEILPEQAGRPGRAVVRRAVPFSLVDGGAPTTLRAAAPTVGEALATSGVAVYPADIVQPPLEAALAPGLRVAIQRARPVTIGGPDVHLETRSRAESVGALLAEQGVPLGELDLVEPGLEAPVPAYGSVRVVRVREETEQVLIPLLFGTRQQVQAGLTPGARVRLQTGQEGVIEQTVRVRFEDGAEVSRQTLGETRREPVEEVIGIGPAVVAAVVPAAPAPAAPPRSATAPAPSGGPEGARRSMSMVATAYDPGPASTGKSPGHPAYGITASGMRAGYGVVAVDPRVIPLGTRLYIPGYGNAIAGDTGGAIKGQRIDLGYATYNEAIRFGRQTVTVYVLD